MLFQPEALYCHLGASGDIRRVPGGRAFWSQPEATLNEVGKDWLVSECTSHSDWADWEMHPDGDELVYPLDGDIELWLDLPALLQRHRVQGHGAVAVPRGVWHTAKMFEPSLMLFVTRGMNTQHKPAMPRVADEPTAPVAEADRDAPTGAAARRRHGSGVR